MIVCTTRISIYCHPKHLLRLRCKRFPLQVCNFGGRLAAAHSFVFDFLSTDSVPPPSTPDKLNWIVFHAIRQCSFLWIVLSMTIVIQHGENEIHHSPTMVDGQGKRRLIWLERSSVSVNVQTMLCLIIAFSGNCFFLAQRQKSHTLLLRCDVMHGGAHDRC